MSLGKLAVWHHPASTGAKARVILTHGICEHSGRHLNTINALNAAGYEVIRYDLRGSGQSGGRHQYIDKFEDYVADAIAIFNWSQASLPPLPIFLMGHSMGGLITLYTAVPIQKLISGMILSAPAFIAGAAISPLKVAVGRIINRIMPTFRVPGSSDKDCLSRIPEVSVAYHTDPLSYHFNTVRQGSEVLNAMARIPSITAGITTPLLIAHGTDDRLILLEGSYRIFRSVSSKSRTFSVVPGGYHEIHNNLGKEEYFRTLQFWLDDQLAQSKVEQRAAAEDSSTAPGKAPQSQQSQP